MSHPIKIVEDSIQPQIKNIGIYQLNQANDNQKIPNSFFQQSEQINNTLPSLTLNQSSHLSIQSTISLFHNDYLFHIKENNKQEIESINKISEPNSLKINKNCDFSLYQEKKLEKIMDQPETGNCSALLESENKNSNIKEMFLEYINKDNSEEYINKNNKSQNFNICLDEKKINKLSGVDEYYQSIKYYSDKIVNILQSICAENEYLFKNSKDLDLNNSEKNLDNKSKINKNNIKDIIIHINAKILNSKEKDSKEEEESFSTTKKQSDFIEKENNTKSYLNTNISKSKNILKQKNHERKGDNNINTKNSIHHNKVKNFKRINNRKFNIKSRGLRYNILTEEIKKKLLIDATNMRTVEVAKKYGISTRNVNRWKKKGIQRKKGSGRKFKDPRLEKKILEWYKLQDKETLTSRQFKQKAIELSENKTFRASSGWLTNMKRKYNLNFKKY